MKKRGLIFTGFLLFIFFIKITSSVFPGATWQERTPEELGLDRTKLDQFANNVGGVGVIVKDGYIVKKWGTQSTKADWASAAKPVISTLLFFAIEEGRLSGVDDLIRNQGWNLISKDQTMTFHHLANMVSGYARGETPGSAWAYNDYAIRLYGLTMENVFGQSLNNAVLQRLAPLQFQDGSIFSSRSGLGVSTSPRDFARIGWLWLNKGNWNGNQILPEHYFDNYMKPHVSNNLARTSASGNDYLGIGTFGGGSDQFQYGPGIYGYNWWFNDNVGTSSSLTWPDAPLDTFQANGHWNQEVITIIPSLNMVVAAIGNWGSFSPGSTSGMNQNLKLLKEAVPQTGHIKVDSNNPQWLIREGKGPLFICGPGDPEDFLYRGTRNSDGTRNGDQMNLINKLKGTGANSIYMQIIRSHGGDGASDHNPFINSDPSQSLDNDILNQWETWFTEMDNNDIVIYLFFYDDSASIWNTGDSVGTSERNFIQGIVNRFEHHRNLIWVVAEEYPEKFSATRVSNIASEIRAADDNVHPIAVHKLSGLTFSEFANNANIDQFAIQYNVDSSSQLHSGMLTAWNNANGRYNLNLAEAANYGTGETARKKNWAIATGGAYVMVYEWFIDTTAISDLQECGYLVNFMESLDLSLMAPSDGLVNNGYCLADIGSEYVVYLENGGNVNVDLSGTSGTLNYEWYNPRTGTYSNQGTIQGGLTRSFTAPDSNDWVLHIYGGVASNYQCSNGVDDDGDGQTDYPDDAGCTNANDNDESNCGDLQCEGGETCSTCTTDCCSESVQITNLNAVSGRTYEIVGNGLQETELIYIDRDYTISYVPLEYLGETYIKTANDDKTFSGSSFLSFDVDQDVIVYVAYDDRIFTKPTWLLSFSDTGNNLVTSDTTLSLYEKNFFQGRVVLGANEGSSTDNSMYSVVVVAQEESSSTCGGADIGNPRDGVVSITELITYISNWKSGLVSINELITAIGEWKSGC